MSYKEIKFEVENEVGWITINRPQRRNALSRDVWLGIGQVLVDTIDDIDIRVLVLTGNDEKIKGKSSFSAGLDIKEMATA